MYYIIESGKLVRSEDLHENSPGIALMTYTPEKVPENTFNIASSVLSEAFSRSTFRFESCESFELICMRLIHIEHYSRTDAPLYIFFKNNRLIFYAVKTEEIESRLDKICGGNIASLGEVLYHFLTEQINGDLKHLEGFEESFTRLEEAIFTDSQNKGYTKKFISIRKDLRRIKLYYEQFLSIMNDIEANDNGLFDHHSLKQFKILSSKIERLYAKVISLMDYVAEIRSAYQAEVDLSLNKTMKVLTVISVIVLPLSLIAGWYGMNFTMPEYNSPFGYPAVIVLSVLVLAASVIYFKKHKL